jgi:N-acetylneuraminic acid mutarotase
MKAITSRWLNCIGLLVLAAAVAGCGGGGGSASATAPTIGNLQFYPEAVYVSTTPAIFSGSISFSDPDGDLASATIAILDGGGGTVSTVSTPVQSASGVTSGTIQGSITAAVSVAGSYTFQVYVTDVRGLHSNTLSGPVRIAPFPWTSKLASPTAREYAAVAVLNNRVYVIGGQRTDAGVTPGPVTAIVETYDPATNTWGTAPPMPTARMGLVAAVANGRLYAIGGSLDGFGAGTGTVEEFDPLTLQWTTRSSMPTPRCFAGGALVGNRIVVAGGRTLGVHAMNVVEIYDVPANTWSPAMPLPTARSDFSAVESGGLVYAIGGYGGLLAQWVGTVEAYNPAIGTWTTRASMPTARSHIALVSVGTKLLAAGGENVNRALDVLESYDVTTNAWSTKTPSPSFFSRAPAAVFSGKAYVIGNGSALEYNPANEIR